MKTNVKGVALTGIASLAFAVGAGGEGLIALDNSLNLNGVLEFPGNGGPSFYYTGTFGMEVWELNATTPPYFNPVTSYPLGYYFTMEQDGFKQEATFADQQMRLPGHLRV